MKFNQGDLVTYEALEISSYAKINGTIGLCIPLDEIGEKYGFVENAYVVHLDRDVGVFLEEITELVWYGSTLVIGESHLILRERANNVN